MADSTPYVLAAGGLVVANRVLVTSDYQAAVKIGAATGIAALATAGIDKAFPGLGVGLGILMCVVAVLTNGVPFLEFVTGTKLGAGRTFLPETTAKNKAGL